MVRWKFWHLCFFHARNYKRNESTASMSLFNSTRLRSRFDSNRNRAFSAGSAGIPSLSEVATVPGGTRPAANPATTPPPSKSPVFLRLPKNPGYTSSREQYLRQVRAWNRRIATLLVCFSSILSLLGTTIYHIGFLFSFTRSDDVFYIDFGLTMLFYGIIAFGCSLGVAYYKSLPNVAKYGALLGVNKLLVKYPYLVSKIARWTAGVSAGIYTITFIMVLISTELRFIADTINVLVLALALLVLLVSLIFTVTSVAPIYSEAVKRFSSTASDGLRSGKKLKRNEVNAIRSALRSTLVAKWVLILLGPGAILLDLFAAASGLREQYIIFNLTLLFYYLANIMITILLMKTDGGFSPKHY